MISSRIVCNGGGGAGGGDGDGDRARALDDLGFPEAGLPFTLTSELVLGATSEADGSSGPMLALSLTSKAMGEACCESGGGGAIEVTRAGGDFWFCSSISTSESMFCIDEKSG